MAGIFYGVGVGPGDPELMTLKAVRLIRESGVVAVPAVRGEESAAYRIAVQAVPELAEKELLALDMPMIHHRAELERSHDRAAAAVAERLARGEDVVFLTLGDPAVYSTFSYLQARVSALGYETRMVSGVTSFCAAAARLNMPLVEWDQSLHVIPTAHRLELGLELPGTCVLMKAGKELARVKAALAGSGRETVMVENCGMPGERIFRGTGSIPAETGYYTLMLVKEPAGGKP